MAYDNLAHAGIAASIIERFAGEPHAMVRLTGPPGSGRTWTALRVAALWEQQGGAVLFAQGDDATASRPLDPFVLGVTDRSPRWGKLIRKSARGTIGLAEKVIGSPGAGGPLFDLLATAIDQKFERATRPLSGVDCPVGIERAHQHRFPAHHRQYADQGAGLGAGRLESGAPRRVPDHDRS